MINGLKLTMHGEALKARVGERIGRLEAAIEQYREGLKMNPKDQTDDHPALPDHMLENMIGECQERIAALTLIRDHIVPGEVYLLDQADLQFAELLPPPPEPEWPICMGRR
jgi:hypothetical protein